MKLEIDKDILKEIVGTLKVSLSKGGINPIFEHFLFDVKENKLTIKATDTKLSALFQCHVDNTDSFSFTLNGGNLSSLLSNLDGDTVILEYILETNDIKLTCGKYKLDCSSGNTEEFPNIVFPNIENLKVIKLPEFFIGMLKSVSFSIGSDVSKKDLNSLCMDINKDSTGNLTLVTTDRIRLSYAVTPITDTGETLRFIISKNSILEIEKLEPTHLVFGSDKQRLYFHKETKFGSYIFQTVLANVIYPDIYSYLTEDFEESVVLKFNRRAVLRVLKRVRLTSDKTNKGGNFDFVEGLMTISALSSSNKSKEDVVIENVQGTPLSFSVNLDYLMEYLNQETEDMITLKIIDNSCLVFDKKDYRHVLALNS